MTFLLGESTDKEMIAIAERLNFINQTAYMCNAYSEQTNKKIWILKGNDLCYIIF